MSPAAQVLTDPVLWRCITSFQYGLPLPLYEFWVAHEPAVATSQDPDLIRNGLDRLMELVITHGTLHLLHQFVNVRYNRANRKSTYTQWEIKGFDGVVDQAINANRADMLEYAITHKARCGKLRDLWHSAIRSIQDGEDVRILDVLQAHKPIAAKHLKGWTSELKHVRLAQWFDTHYPGVLDKENMEYATREGNLTIAKYMVEHHPTIQIGTWPFKCAHQRGHFDILRYLLEKLPAQVDTDFIKRLLQKGDKELLTMLREVGGFEAHVHREATNYIQYGHLDQLERLFDEGLLTKESEFSIDDAASSGQLDVIELLMERATATATTEAMDGAITGKGVDFILLQETHVVSETEAAGLAAQWSRGWGRKPDAARPLSFWSITENKTGGVAILLHPRLQGLFQAEITSQPGRWLRIGSADCVVNNIYAPNLRSEREVFYEAVHDGVREEKRQIWLAGDFNCVLKPTVDRVTGGTWSTAAGESPALAALVVGVELVDVARRELETEMAASGRLEDITYWNDTSGARLDRCYTTRAHVHHVDGYDTVTPHGPTDHRGVVTWFRAPGSRPLVRAIQPSLYPQSGRNPAAINTAIGQAVGTTMVSASSRGLAWDYVIQHLREALLMVKKAEKKRAQRQRKRANAKQRRSIRTLRDLIEYVQSRVEQKSTVRRSEHILARSGHSEHLFRRFVQIDQGRHIPQLSQEDTSTREAPTRADVMAAAWKPLFGQRHAAVTAEDRMMACRRLYNVPDQYRLDPQDNERLMAPITEEEVTRTIKHLGAHKAAGPDRIGNDFYRDWSEFVVPVLTQEYNRILAGAAMPASFSEAIIVPLAKGGDATDATNYRPISLLQSSYKIFTKLLAHRVQESLGKVINADQNGFVRGRALANNIHIMRAVLEQAVPTDKLQASDAAAVVLLDFRKAYDTLDRSFVSVALRDFGYSAAFTELVERLHTSTSAQFLVNGELSVEFDVVTGIRQGCPLAPLLFLVAVETLKHAIDQDAQLGGIVIQGGDTEHQHTFSAFVDDSVVFLTTGAMVEALESVLQRFADVSGLQVQPHKSHAIILNPSCTATSLGSFPTVPVGSTVTYLGVEVGLADLDTANWAKRSASIQARLGILSKYTTGVRDRVQVINLACIPSLLYTAQFFTPSRQVQLSLDAIWRQYVWHGTLTGATQRAHKIASEIVHLPTSLAGLGLRDYRGAMLAQAATTILQWNSRRHDKYWAAFHSMLKARMPKETATVRSYPAAPKSVGVHSLATGTNLLQLGYRLVNQALSMAYPHPPGLLQAKCTILSQNTAPAAGLRWLTSRKCELQLRGGDQQWNQLAQLNYAQMPNEIRTYWNTFPWYDNTWIRDAGGHTLRRAQYPWIKIDKLGDLALRATGDGKYQFQNPLNHDTPRYRTTVTRLATWVQIIIANWAALPGEPAVHETTRVFSSTRHPVFDQYRWTLTATDTITGIKTYGLDEGTEDTDTVIHAHIREWRDPIDFGAGVASTRGQEDLRLLQDARIFLDGHPDCQHGPTMRSVAPSTAAPTASRIVHAIIRPRLETTYEGLDKMIQRLERQVDKHPELGTALQSGVATNFQRQPWGVTSQQQFFRYRLTIGALNLRDQEGRMQRCPYDFCAGADHDAEHVVWSCAGARGFWQRIFRRWCQPSTAPLTPTAALRLVFEAQPPVLAAATRQLLHDLTDNDEVITKTVRRTWQVICYVATQQLWLTRNDTLFRENQPSRPEHIATISAATVRQLAVLGTGLRQRPTTRMQGRAVDILVQALQADAEPISMINDDVRLYFDGGSRGNPGITGTGSVLVARTTGAAQWQLVWWDAYYVGENSTNNVAEHTALLRGLAECSRRYGGRAQHITIIGDSQLILHQLAGVARAAQHDIRSLLTRSRAHLRTIHSYSLEHTLRDGNKMADRLANWAMDHRCASQTAPTDIELEADLQRYKDHDTEAPWSTHERHNQLLPHLRRHHTTVTSYSYHRKRRRSIAT